MLFSSIISLVLHTFMLITTKTVCIEVHVCGKNTSLLIPLHKLPVTIVAPSYNISFCSENSVLDGNLDFFNKDAVSLIGKVNSTVTCYGQSAGIHFRNVRYIQFQNMILNNCGSVHNPYNNPYQFSSCIFIENGSSISLRSVSILNSQGSGMVVLQSYALINITDCYFKNGSAKTNTSCGGGGMYLELACYPTKGASQCTRSKMTLNITNTQFEANHAGVVNRIGSNCYNFESGGGASFLLKGSANNNVITIQNCTFMSNNALSKSSFGGGLIITIFNWSKNNKIMVENSTFCKNTCKYGGGGGADIGFLSKSVTSFPRDNRFAFVNTTFEQNSAKFGAGTLVYSTTAELNTFESNEVLFINCLWIDNAARYSSAVYLNLNNPGTYNSAGFLPKITFVNGTLKGNRIIDHIKSTERYEHINSYYVHKRGKGSFFSIGYKVTFNSSMRFINNSGSALYLASSIVKINSGSTVSFAGNTGHYGGAISFLGTSILHLHNNVTLNFSDNTAIVKGGAIYQEHVDTLEYISLRKCFFHYSSRFRGTDGGNITCLFRNNQVINSDPNSESLIHGHSIYMHSLDSCKSITKFTKKPKIGTNYVEYSGPVARFIFENSTRNEISTAGTKFKVKMHIINNKVPIIPGKVTDLPIEVNDDFNRTVFRIYQALLKTDPHNSHNMSIDPKYVHIYYNQILLYGSPGDGGNVTFSLSSIGDEEVILPFELIDCPPGYVIEKEGGLTSCICSTEDRVKQYLGISHCNQSRFQATLKQGYWLAYKNKSHHTEGEYIVSHSCPRSFCSRNESYYLPNISSPHELDKVICGRERTGVLCGECRENYSAFYHSQDFECAYMISTATWVGCCTSLLK